MRTTQVFSRNQCFKPSRPLTTPGSASSLLLPPCLFPTPKLNHAPCHGALFCPLQSSEWVGVSCVLGCRSRGWKGAWSEDRNLESRSFSAAKIRKETGRGGVTTARETTSQEKLLRSFQVNSHLGVQLRRLEDLFRPSTRSPAKTPDSSLLLQPFRCPSVSANITFAVLPSISGLASSRADWNLQIITTSLSGYLRRLCRGLH